jgi:hypothetical protein
VRHNRTPGQRNEEILRNVHQHPRGQPMTITTQITPSNYRIAERIGRADCPPDALGGAGSLQCRAACITASRTTAAGQDAYLHAKNSELVRAEQGRLRFTIRCLRKYTHSEFSGVCKPLSGRRPQPEGHVDGVGNGDRRLTCARATEGRWSRPNMVQLPSTVSRGGGCGDRKPSDWHSHINE